MISFFFFFFFFSFFFQTSLTFKCHIVCDCDWALESFGDLFTYYCSWVTSTLLIPAKQANKKLWELIFPIDHGHRIRNLSIKRKNSFVHTCRSFLVLETSCSPMATQPTKQNHQTSRLNEWLKKNTPRPFSTWLTHLQAFSELFFNSYEKSMSTCKSFEEKHPSVRSFSFSFSWLFLSSIHTDTKIMTIQNTFM